MKHWSIILFAFAFVQWFFPKWNGIFSGSISDMTTGDSRIIASIAFVGAIILWQLTKRENSKSN